MRTSQGYTQGDSPDNRLTGFSPLEGSRDHPDKFSYYNKATVSTNSHQRFPGTVQHKEKYQGEGGHFLPKRAFFSSCLSKCNFPRICVLSVKSNMSEFNGLKILDLKRYQVMHPYKSEPD